MRVLRETQSENVAPTTPRSEVGALPRHKTVDEVTKVAEARLQDLRQEKYTLLNEREDLKTEIQLGRQRELKLKAQVDKLESLIARYKERATQHQHVHEEHATLQHDKDTMASELQLVRENAALVSAQCKELETALQTWQAHCVATTDAASARMDHMWKYLEYMNAQQRQMQASLRTTQQRYQQQVAQWEQRLLAQEADLAYASDALEQQRMELDVLSMERSQFEQALHDAEDQILQLSLRDVDDSGQHDSDMVLQDQYDKLSVDVKISTMDALCSQSQWETEQERSAWLLSRLQDTEAVHHRLLQTLKNERVKHAEEANAQKELVAAQERIAELLQTNAELSDELNRVAWFEEAYQARTQQADLLKELAKLNETHEEQLKDLHRLREDQQEATELQGLSKRIELLHKEEEDMRQHRNALAWHAQELGKFLAQQSEAVQEPRRRVSDTAYFRAKRAPHASSLLHS
ncbi:hypothetical protein MNAN1_001413 [Malassezia nana]|uniref:Uncharacterized protein n=1 Tax=Malassezia nana TaxID=180528 RepID=A0AAF0EPD9_9BASI|nr:hypothetical protein MNAN1_001413 [Malassezia nana]